MDPVRAPRQSRRSPDRETTHHAAARGGRGALRHSTDLARQHRVTEAMSGAEGRPPRARISTGVHTRIQNTEYIRDNKDTVG